MTRRGNCARTFVGFAMAATLGLSAPANAANCWSASAVSAAQVREFQAMMMAVTLRCAANGASIHDSYNGFVRANLPTLNAASTTLSRQFGAGRSGQVAYDRYTTELSNRYGSGHTSLSSCAAFAEIGNRAARAATAAGSLAMFAAEVVPQPYSVGDKCAMTTATAAAATVTKGIETASR